MFYIVISQDCFQGVVLLDRHVIYSVMFFFSAKEEKTVIQYNKKCCPFSYLTGNVLIIYFGNSHLKSYSNGRHFVFPNILCFYSIYSPPYKHITIYTIL